MASPPKPVRLNLEDFPGAPEWFEKVVTTVNPFFNDTTNALSKKLTPEDNLSFEYKTVDVIAPDWVTVATTGSTDPYFKNSWDNLVNEQPAQFICGDDGWVSFRGTIDSGTATPGTVIFTLPTGYAPAVRQRFAVTSYDGVTVMHGEVNVVDDGDVEINAGDNTYLSLAGIRYQITAPPAFVGPGWPIVLQHSIPARVRDVTVSAVRDFETDAIVPLSGSPAWHLNSDGSVQITRVSNLMPGRKYTITFLLIP